MTGEEIAAAAQLACLLEVSAPKPGNVAPGLHFHDTRYEDFLASAVAIGPPLARAGERPLGATIRAAVEATRRLTGRNTNLGMVLLLAPLCRAAARALGGPGASLGEKGGLRGAVERVLEETTVADAEEVYAAIRLAAPGGLGIAPSQDVAGRPTVPLREAMALARERDAVAGEYATGFALTFDLGAPALRRARADRLDWTDATVETYLRILATVPDSHIARKLGRAAAERVTGKAREIEGLGGVRSTAGRAALRALDAELRDERNAWNPGTTADLTGAALCVVILEDGWRSAGDGLRAG